MADSGAPTDPSTVEPAEGAFRLRFAAVSDVGRHRKENQDSGYAGDHLLVVADGVGGAAYGDVASATAVHLLRRLDHRPDGEMLPELAGAMHRIHDRLAELVEQDSELDGTSTTVTAALFDGERLGFAHAGDSRAYLLRGGEIRQLTKDHTFVQTLVDEGRITEAEARVHPHRNIILKAVDGVHDTEPDLFYIEAQAGDRILLCSDGCSGAVEDADLGRLLAQGTVDGAAGSLVQAALDGGTTDNVTVVVAEIVPADPRPAGSRTADSTSADSDGVVAAPLVVGAAAVSPRRGGMLGRALFRGRLDGSRGDTGEIEPVLDEPVDPEELRYAPRAPRRGRIWRRLLLILVPLLLIAAALVGAYSWSQNQYYVAADGPDVAIFRGVQVDIPGVDLSSTYEVSDVKLADLPPVNQADVKAGISADNLSDAHRIVDVLSGLVATCPPAQQHHHHKHQQQSGKHHAATSQHHKKQAGSTTKPKAGSARTHNQKSGPSASPSPSPSASSGSGSGSGSGVRQWVGRLHQRGDAVSAVASAGFVHRRRRGAELTLLIMALAVGIGAYAAVGLGVKGRVPADIVGYSLWLAALALAAHLVVRMTAPYADPVLLPVATALNGLGLAVIYRIDLALRTSQSAKQLMWTTLGVGLFATVLIVIRDHRRLQAYTYTIGLGAIVLLLLPLVPGLGTEINGARIWIGIGNFSFQPGEVAKVALVIAFAGYLVLHRDALALAGRRFAGIDLPRGRDLGPILAIWLISLGVLVFERDLGSSLLFFGLFVVMLYVATERPGWLVVGTGLFAAGSLAAYAMFAHVQERVDGWLHPFSDTARFGQIIEGLYGMAWGGLVGRGLGQGDPWRVPFSYSDFIVAAVGEELGLTGIMALLLLFGIIVERALRTALICRDDFGKLVATGLGMVFALQVFVVVGGVTRLIPLTGLTTPFMSYGGSSMVANWVVIGLLLRISDQVRRPLPELQPLEMDEATTVVPAVRV